MFGRSFMGGLLEWGFIEMAERAEFEKVLVSLGYAPAWDGNGYLYEEVQVAWQVWQAARSQSPDHIADSSKMVASERESREAFEQFAIKELGITARGESPGWRLWQAALEWQAARAQDEPSSGVPDVGAMADVLGEWVRNTTGTALTHVTLVDMVRAMLTSAPAAPAVQWEPVGWQFYQDGKWWHGYDRIKDHRKNTEEAGFLVRDLYAAPHPAEQQPAPDVAGLVEALTELCDEIDKHDIHAAISKTSISWFKRKARKALAAYRKGAQP